MCNAGWTLRFRPLIPSIASCGFSAVYESQYPGPLPVDYLSDYLQPHPMALKLSSLDSLHSFLLNMMYLPEGLMMQSSRRSRHIQVGHLFRRRRVLLPKDAILCPHPSRLATLAGRMSFRCSTFHYFAFGFECSYRHSPSFTPPALKQSRHRPHKRSLCIFFTTSTAKLKRVLTCSQKSHLSQSS